MGTDKREAISHHRMCQLLDQTVYGATGAQKNWGSPLLLWDVWGPNSDQLEEQEALLPELSPQCHIVSSSPISSCPPNFYNVFFLLRCDLWITKFTILKWSGYSTQMLIGIQRGCSDQPIRSWKHCKPKVHFVCKPARLGNGVLWLGAVSSYGCPKWLVPEEVKPHDLKCNVL